LRVTSRPQKETSFLETFTEETYKRDQIEIFRPTKETNMTKETNEHETSRTTKEAYFLVSAVLQRVRQSGESPDGATLW